MAGRGQPRYPLRVAAQLVGLGPRTLRVYEEARLLEPARAGAGNRRMYSEQDLQWLRCIRDMIHEEGLTVVAIRRLLDLIPCWELRRCDPQTALECAPCQNVPQMAREGLPATAPAPAPQVPVEADFAGKIRIKLIYGVEELGAVLPCMRCIAAERAARKVALKYPDQVVVTRHDLLSEEAAPYGALLVPTVIVGDEIVSSGQGISEERLGRVIERRLGAGAVSAS